MKKLPRMYHNKIDKDIKNNEKIYNSMNDSNIEINIEEKIRDIFNYPDYVYKIDVTIITNKGNMNKKIIGKNKDNLITIDNEYIPICDIIDIYKNS